MQEATGLVSGTQQRPAGGGRSVRVPHPKPGFRQTRRVLPTVTEKVSTALLLGETPQGRNRHGKDAADAIYHSKINLNVFFWHFFFCRTTIHLCLRKRCINHILSQGFLTSFRIAI